MAIDSLTLSSGGTSATITAARVAEGDAPSAADAVSGIVSQRPEAHPWAPPAESFADGDDFQDAPELAQIGRTIVTRYPEFAHLHDALHPVNVHYFWKRKGGLRGGRETWGACLKPSGLLAHVSGATFLVWIAADHVRDNRLSNHQLEALLYHELRHAGIEVDEDEASPTYGEVRYVLRGHEHELFGGELERYGLWHGGHRALDARWRQLAIAAGS